MHCCGCPYLWLDLLAYGGWWRHGNLGRLLMDVRHV
jgi:hypothetical protein